MQPPFTHPAGRLLARTVPQVIKTEEENERLLAVVESLMQKGEESLTPEEDALLDLLTDLIHDFESKTYPIPRSEPHKMVAFLLEHRGLKPSVEGARLRDSERETFHQ